MNERLFAIVSGRVQLVMFRDFTQRKASALKLVGYVKNLSNGTVEVIVEGPHERLEKLLTKLHRGPLLARVSNVAEQWQVATGEFSKFKISYD